MSRDQQRIGRFPASSWSTTGFWKPAVPDEARKAVEAAALRQLCAGERMATERFVREHTGWMLVLAKRYLKDRALAEDCVQEAFLQAFRNIRGFEGRSTLKSWLFRIVVNAALMRLRSHRGSGEQCLDDVLAEVERGGYGRDQPWGEIATPQDMLQRKEAQELVVAKLTELPDGYRIVLLLRDIEGYSTEEAAKALGMTEGALKVRLHRARAAFKVLVEPVLAQYV
jgi:RNA polymerase sigma-70 factor, ECF subfamily